MWIIGWWENYDGFSGRFYGPFATEEEADAVAEVLTEEDSAIGGYWASAEVEAWPPKEE